MKTILDLENDIPADFVEMVKKMLKTDVRTIVLSHKAFDIEETDIFGKTIKYACMHGITVNIVGS